MAIHIIENVASRFGALDHFQKKLQEAFWRAGIASTSFNLEKQSEEEILCAFQREPPQFTLGFNVILSGQSFLEPLGVRHIAALVDPVWQFPEILTAPRVIAAFVEKESLNLYDKDSLYLPHAVEPELLRAREETARDYDVVLTASFIDSQKELRAWQGIFSKETASTLQRIAEDVLARPSTTLLYELISAYPEIQEEIEAKGLPHFQLLASLSNYIRGEDRIRLVRALKDSEIHLFCPHEDATRWKELGKMQYHGQAPFTLLPTIYKKSRVVLHSAPHMRQGFHERLFMAIACGASVVSMNNACYNDAFGVNRANIALKAHKEAQVKIEDALSDEKKRLSDIDAAREVIAQAHTWDNRVEALLKSDLLCKKIFS